MWFFKNTIPVICDQEFESQVEILSETSVVDCELNYDVTRTHQVLNKLLETANQNVTRPKQGYRFDNEVRNWASYLRMHAGPMAYNDIQRNLEGALPALVSTNRYVKRSSQSISEGVLRHKELLIYLNERNLPLAIGLSEDATRIEGRVQFDSSTNQLIGFVLPISGHNGLPTPNVYKARNAEEIVGHFVEKNPTAKFAITIMAQPIADVPAFCLMIFGSDNRDTTCDVLNRWMHIVSELKKIGITVLTLSSDSDPKYNAAMRQIARISCVPNPIFNKNWFNCNPNLEGPVCIQDPLHILTKMRNSLLKTIRIPRKYPFGPKFFINISHVEYLLQHFRKDKHQLTATILNPIDRMNTPSALRLCDENVIELLKNHVKNSNATVIYLQIMRDYIDAFTDRNLSPLDRVKKVWYSMFIVRLWRQYILSKKSLTLSNNFLTSNCYSCLELNAHGLILIMLSLKKKNNDDHFRPHHFSSQPCEEFYRQIRSFTSTYSTVANCTVKDILGRIHKIQLQNDIGYSSRGTFIFPKKSALNLSDCQQKYTLPSYKEIFEEIEMCKAKAIENAIAIGILSQHNANINISCADIAFKPKLIDEYEDIETECDKKSDNIESIMSYLKSTSLHNFSEKVPDESINENSPYVRIPSDKKRIVLKKTALCWLLGEVSPKLSSDRLERVKAWKKTNGKNNMYMSSFIKIKKCKKAKMFKRN